MRKAQVLAKKYEIVHDLYMYSTFSNIKESVVLAWKHKILWILALMAMGAGFSFQNTFSSLPDIGGEDSESTKEEVQKVTSLNQKVSASNYYVPLPDMDVSVTWPPEGDTTTEYYSVSNNQGSVTVTYEGDPSFNDNVVSEPVGSTEEIDYSNYPVGSQLPVSGVAPENIFGSFKVADFLTLIPPIVFAFMAILFFAAVSLMVNGWAKGAFYSGLLKACKSEEYGFKTLGDGGRNYWKRMVFLDLYLLLKIFLSQLPLLASGFLFAIFSGAGKDSALPGIIFAIIGFAALIWFIAYNFRLIFVRHYSHRLLVMDNLGVKEAYKLGWSYYRTRPGKSIKLFFALILVFIGALVVAGIAVGMVAALLKLLADQHVSYVVLGLVSFPFLLAGTGLLVVAGPYVNTVAAFSYTKLFLFIRESFESKNEPVQEPVLPVLNSEVTNNGQI